MSFPSSAETSSLYQKVIGTSISASRVPAIGLVPEHTLPSFALRKAYAHFPSDGEGSEEREHILLRRITSRHRRSFNVERDENKSEDDVLWFDEFGNPYMDYNIKGGEFEHPFVYRGMVGYVCYGIQTSSQLQREISTSHILRAHGVETEAVTDLHNPDEFYYDGKMIPASALREVIIDDIRSGRAQELAHSLNFVGVSPEEADKAEEYFREEDFDMTERGIQSDERIGDLVEVKNKSEFINMMTRVFKFVNAKEKMLASKDITYIPYSFDAQDDSDILYYFSDYFPKTLARNLAKMHNLGIVHHQMHRDNVSLSGGFYDLDSAEGEPLGDRPMNEMDKLSDILPVLGYSYLTPTLDTIQAVLLGLGYMKYLDEIGPDFSIRLLEEYQATLSQPSAFVDNLLELHVNKDNPATKEFVKGYMRDTISQAPSVLPYIEFIYYVFDEFFANEDFEFRDEIIKRVASELGWEYKFSKPPDEVFQEFIENDKNVLAKIIAGEIEKERVGLYASDRAIDYVNREVRNDMDSNYEGIHKDLIAQYNENFADIIFSLLFYKETTRVHSEIEDKYESFFDTEDETWEKSLQLY